MSLRVVPKIEQTKIQYFHAVRCGSLDSLEGVAAQEGADKKWIVLEVSSGKLRPAGAGQPGGEHQQAHQSSWVPCAGKNKSISKYLDKFYSILLCVLTGTTLQCREKSACQPEFSRGVKPSSVISTTACLKAGPGFESQPGTLGDSSLCNSDENSQEKSFVH